MKPELTAGRLRELLHYDPETGVFTRLARTSNSIKVGDVAGTADSDGYIQISVDGVLYRAHRLAWLYMTGAWSKGVIDHVNGVKGDNRFANLRPATNAENQQNQRRAQSSNKLGLLGVCRVCREGKRFKAQIMVDGRQIYLGTFDTPEQAHAAYLAAKRRLHSGCTL